MAQQHGRVALYTAVDHRFLFDGWAHYRPQHNEPKQEQDDRYRRTSLLLPGGGYEVARPHRGTLTFLRPRFMLRKAQVKSAGVWSEDAGVGNSTVLLDWLYAKTILDNQQFIVYVESHGRRAGSEYFRRRFYKGYVSRVNGSQDLESMFGDLMGSDGLIMPRWIALSFVNQDCGSFTDFNDLGSLTSDGAWPV